MKKLFWILGIMVAFTGCVKEDVRNEDIIQIETENVFDRPLLFLLNRKYFSLYFSKCQNSIAFSRRRIYNSHCDWIL